MITIQDEYKALMRLCDEVERTWLANKQFINNGIDILAYNCYMYTIALGTNKQ